MVDGVESFREVHRHCHCSMGRTLLVETRDHLLGHWQESCGTRAGGSEAMLGVSKGQVGRNMFLAPQICFPSMEQNQQIN